MRKNNKKFIVNLIVVSVIGLIVLMITMFIGIRAYIDKSSNKANQTIETIKEVDEPTVEYSSTLTLVVKKISKSKLIGYDIEANKEVSKNLSEGTKINDTFGSVITYSQIKPGDIVEIVYQEEKAKVLSITKSAKAKTFKRINGVTVDVTNKEMNIGGTTYLYTDDTLVVYGQGDQTNMAFVDPFDILTIQSLNGVVWSVTIEEEAATITFKDFPTTDGKIELDRSRFINIDDIQGPISVIPGEHKILIQMKGYEIINESVVAVSGENYEFDLKDAEEAYTIVKPLVSSEIQDYTIKIDDKTYGKGDEIKLQEGTYTLLAQAEGYKDFKKEIVCSGKEYSPYISFVADTAKQNNVVNNATNNELNETMNNSHSITINTDPIGATVYIDGAKKGTTPYTVTLMNGSYSILLEKEGYNVYSTNIILDNASTQTGFLYILNKLE